MMCFLFSKLPSLSGMVSIRTSSSTRSWVRMVWAMAMPTLPAPMTGSGDWMRRAVRRLG
ncbi:hypothetical protein RchiOBHm_Chr5g0039561 [Rosa chinensis]|uniref:Uncharacterized protein n=1 Tax=Rosa chinensis TaxID=74649 RepID=A0A2P6QCA8_ROSCH|nr:hypothetical protein RchiOBHm_Chr5g0039561 [Rosa chinensis]